jgi:hypothetical protein
MTIEQQIKKALLFNRDDSIKKIERDDSYCHIITNENGFDRHYDAILTKRGLIQKHSLRIA